MFNLHDCLPIMYLNTDEPAIFFKNDYYCSVLLENAGNGISKLVDDGIALMGARLWRSGLHNRLLHFPRKLLQNVLKALYLSVLVVSS